MIHKISGGTSSLELYEDYLIIQPSNIQRLNGQTQTIPLESVVTISIVKPFLKVPYLQVITPNLQQTKKDNLKGAAANVVLIQPGNMKTAEKIRDYITNYKTNRSLRSSSQPPQPSHSIQDLRALSELKDAGIITQEEFDAKKKQILGL
ncbi:SHOCT domain-containing protein [Cohnella sp. GCM10020058]|uniref:SHOCT domain-containing protein n=1 Tax=Cohnella sp. GCM10020058 TaxID=3317330 RepID=UPI003641890E